MKLRHLFSAMLILAIGLSPLRLQADGLVRDGLGPISTGRGGTNQGFADNAAIIIDNPGAMVNIQGSGLVEIGADTVTANVNYTNPSNDVTSHTRPLPMPALGIIKKSDNELWAFGLGAYVPAGFGADYGVLQDPILGPHGYRSIGGLAKIMPAISYAATERLSVGLSVGLAISHAELDGPLYLQSPPLTGLPALLNMQGTGFAPTGSVGMQYKWTEQTTIGATYTEQSAFNLHGAADATMLTPLGPINSHFDGKMRIKWPRSVAAGIKHEFCEHRRLGVDVIWYDWSHAFSQIDVQLSNPTNPIVPFLAPLPIQDALAVRWRNTVSMRLGYEWDSSELNTWRAGYVYHSSPSPNSTLNPYLDGILQHAFSAGYSRKLSRATLNLAYQYTFGQRRYVGDSSFVGDQFSNSTMFAQAHIGMISFLVPF